MSDSSPSHPSRRDLLKAGGAVASGMLLGAGGLHAEEAGGDPTEAVAVGTLDDYPAGTAKTFDAEKFIVLADDEGIWALSTVCTHMAAILTYKAEKGFVCPRHGAVFAADGTRKVGPARKNLPCYQVTIAGGAVSVDPTVEVEIGTKAKRPEE